MSLHDFRVWIESAIPWWVPFVVAAIGLVALWVAITVEDWKKKS